MTELILEHFILTNLLASKCKEILDAFTELNRCSNTLTTNGIDTDGYTKYSAVSDSEVLG